ncbi:MAG: hypothetical protein H7335_04760 [Massilia sp.]|nr:hypothetical protein [Massilia sp.]
MTTTTIRQARLDIDQLDGAVAEALQRVNQALELSKEQCSDVSGGLIAPAIIFGMIPPVKFPWEILFG